VSQSADFKANGTQSEHIPVLANTLSELVNLPQDAVMVDATIGHGGHSFLFGQKFGLAGTIVGFDVDEKSIQTARSKLSSLSCKVIFSQENFANVSKVVRSEGIEKVDFLLADLGICSAQLEDTEKGLSFMRNMPLDMRLDKRLKTTAADIVNSSDEK
jgi:16S rRNA (cytosine1402-N4)-methyltransferase